MAVPRLPGGGQRPVAGRRDVHHQPCAPRTPARSPSAPRSAASPGPERNLPAPALRRRRKQAPPSPPRSPAIRCAASWRAWRPSAVESSAFGPSPHRRPPRVSSAGVAARAGRGLRTPTISAPGKACITERTKGSCSISRADLALLALLALPEALGAAAALGGDQPALAGPFLQPRRPGAGRGWWARRAPARTRWRRAGS